MPKTPRTPKYLREFVLSRCLGCVAKVEQIARDWTRQQNGPIPGFADKAFQDYARQSIADYKQVRRAVLDLIEEKLVMIPGEGLVKAKEESEEST
jgi:hypothetical protein